MKILTTAIMTKFTATTGSPAVNNSLYIALSGRMYKGIANQTTVFPYCVYTPIVGTPDWTFNTTFETVTFDFALFSKQSSSSEIEDLFVYLKALYDNTTMTLTGSNLVYFRRDSYRLIPRDIDGVWAYHVGYKVMTEKV